MREAGLVDVVAVNPRLPYPSYLNLTRQFDALVVNDAPTAHLHDGLNPYLPSTLPDHLGSGTPIWSISEPGSVLSTIEVEHRTCLGDVEGAVQVLRDLVVAGRRVHRLQRDAGEGAST